MRGRPGSTPEQYQARLAAYCARYSVNPLETGLPPFPSGKRETAQHRQWLALYKAHQRLARREALSSPETRREQLARQRGRCPVCAAEVGVEDALDVDRATGAVRGLLHASCEALVRQAEAAGPEGLERVRAYLWPAEARAAGTPLRRAQPLGPGSSRKRLRPWRR